VAREWCLRATKYATEILENIVAELDREEDMVRAASHEERYDLIDEFDSISVDSVEYSAPVDVSDGLSAKQVGGASRLLDAATLLQLQPSLAVAVPSLAPVVPQGYPSLDPVVCLSDSSTLYPNSPSTSPDDVSRYGK
jgi:hypothetical protein